MQITGITQHPYGPAAVWKIAPTSGVLSTLNPATFAA
jgi:hypothetical protein